MTENEQLIRVFATQFPTPNVQRLLAMCENGTISWDQAARIAETSLRKALDETA